MSMEKSPVFKLCCGFKGIIQTRTASFTSHSIYGDTMLVRYGDMTFKRHVSLLFPMLSVIQSSGPDMTVKCPETGDASITLRFMNTYMSVDGNPLSATDHMFQINQLAAPKLADLIWPSREYLYQKIHGRETVEQLRGIHPRMLGLPETQINDMTRTISKGCRVSGTAVADRDINGIDVSIPFKVGYLWLAVDGCTIDWDVVPIFDHQYKKDKFWDATDRVQTWCLTNHRHTGMRFPISINLADTCVRYTPPYGEMLVIRETVIHNIIMKAMDEFRIDLPAMLANSPMTGHIPPDRICNVCGNMLIYHENKYGTCGECCGAAYDAANPK